MVPNAMRPALAAVRAPGTLSRIHAIFVALKYGSNSKPVLRDSSASACGWALLSAAQRSAVRRSCHTMA